MLAGPGAGLRAVIAPAGYGKTTTLAAAVDAARRAGRPVLAVSTTNQAVGQLRQVGIPATTVARFALDHDALPPGCVVIVDEFSQLSTRDAEVVLAAAVACPGGQVWMVGDPLQAQPVGAGGVAVWLSDQVRHGRVATAELTVNRRQADPIERDALRRFRAGDIPTSQDLRDQAGWEHHHADRSQALEAMAAAVLGDLEVYGPDRVAALAVTHADCEALADRIRAELVAQGVITGAVLEGPGWAGPRTYQAGDRILLHAHVDLDDGRRLTNGSVVTVRQVTPAGLAVLDGTGQIAHIAAEVVTGRSRRRPPAGVARLGSHHRRGPGRHLGPGPLVGHPGPGPLPRLCGPIPLHRPHPHLEHHPTVPRRRRPRRTAGHRTAGHPGRTDRRRPGPSPTQNLRRRRRPLPHRGRPARRTRSATEPTCAAVPPTSATASPRPTPPSGPVSVTWPTGSNAWATGKTSRPPPPVCAA